MDLLLAQEKLGVVHLTRGNWTGTRLPYAMDAPCMPCANQTLMAFCSEKDHECLCVKKRGYELISRMPALPGICGICLSPCGRYLYQLGSDADCIHTRLTATGELLYAVKAGVFPRSMCLCNKGRQLLTAGGAVPEAYVFSAPELICQRVISVRHPCFAARECGEGMALVCAAEGHDIQTVVYVLRHQTVRPRKVLELPGQPGGMCLCPDGMHMLLSTPDGLMKISLANGSILWNLPEWPLCMQLYCQGEWALASDTLNGSACLINHFRPWESRVLGSGGNVQACFA